ncbi:MAG TPA: isochorismatase family cysteine hydrolase [Tepidisphaeraceae bacterium]|jgi:nicotinamidase-related amidase|nr:isochorismatase family cysteine hydrolase [Tepidisphaeraceae bacterium]
MANRREPKRKGSGSFQRQRRGDALLIIDAINDLEFPGGEQVLPWAEKMAGRLSVFRLRARRAGIPVIHGNDNFGLWQSSWPDVYRHCTRKGVRGAGVSRKLRPGRGDYFILKPQHSAFYSTSLLPLLHFLGVRRLILSGIATNLCVLFTAHDAHMRAYPMVVLSDCCAAESDFDHNVALKQLERFCNAAICRSDEFRFQKGESRAKSKRRKVEKS